MSWFGSRKSVSDTVAEQQEEARHKSAILNNGVTVILPAQGKTATGFPIEKRDSEIIAYRSWIVRGDGMLYPHNETFGAWVPRKPYLAMCHNLISKPDAHNAPYENCTCGLYALKTQTDKWSYDKRWIMGEVSLWGRVIECDSGYRAQYAYPRKLYATVAHGKELADRLEHTYAIKVEYNPVCDHSENALTGQWVNRGTADKGVVILANPLSVQSLYGKQKKKWGEVLEFCPRAACAPYHQWPLDALNDGMDPVKVKVWGWFGHVAVIQSYSYNMAGSSGFGVPAYTSDGRVITNKENILIAQYAQAIE